MAISTERFSWWAASLLATSLIVSPCAVSATPHEGPTPLLGPSDQSDRSIRNALALLDTPPSVLVDVVDVQQLPRWLGQIVERTCVYVRQGMPRIYVNSSCPIYRAAGDSLFEAMKLAALLHHEMAHLDGEDEIGARVREAITFRALLRRAPADLLTPGIVYAAALERHAAALRVIRKKRASDGTRWTEIRP
jgi:hypothetical protein